MANTITHKKSNVAGKVPATTDLALGELAVNTYDGKAFIKKNVGGTETVVEVGASANAETATKLATPRTINGVSFDGSQNITTPATTSVTAQDLRAMDPVNVPTSKASFYFTTKEGLDTDTAGGTYSDFLALNTYQDASGGGVNGLLFPKNSQAIYHYQGGYGTAAWNAPKQLAYTDSNITGNAATATALAAARAINGVNFNGTANITVPATSGAYFGVTNSDPATGNGLSLYGGYSGGAPSYGAMFAGTATFGTHGAVTGDWATYLTMTGANTRGWIYRHAGANVASISGSGVVTAAGFVGPLTGNAATATTLQTARTINGVSFNGSANITVADSTKLPLAGGTLSGTLFTKTPIYEATLTDIGNGSDAPIRVPEIVLPLDAVGYVPAIHASAMTTSSGYKTHVSMGLYRGSNTWSESGAYIAVGGHDNYPTEAFYFKSGATIGHSSGSINLLGNAASASSVAWTGVSGRPTAVSAFTNDSGYVTGSGVVNSSYRSVIEDTRAGQRTPNDYNVKLASYEFTNLIVSGWHSALTMKGWDNGYTAWQIIGPSDVGAHENWYLRSGVNTVWNSLRAILHSGNYNSYSPTLTGGGASGDWNIRAYPRRADTGGVLNFYWQGQAGQPPWLWGGSNGADMYVYNPSNFNVAGAVNLTTNRTNWSSNGTISAVVGQLAWKNYNNNHTIFDASAGTSPDGTAVNNTNAQIAWAGSYPTLMGWNGANTYGVRVDSARISDVSSSVAAGGDGAITSQHNGNTGWMGRILSKNATSDKAAFLGTYGGIAGVFAHNNALTAWADLYVNTVDGASGGAVRLPATTFINSSQAIHAGNYSSYSPTLTGTGASGTWGINVTGTAAAVPAGATASRPANATGKVYFNTDLNRFEGNNGSDWGSLGAANNIFWENDQVVTANYTVGAGKNAGTFGPITIASGVTVTVPAGSTWSVV